MSSRLIAAWGPPLPQWGHQQKKTFLPKFSHFSSLATEKIIFLQKQLGLRQRNDLPYHNSDNTRNNEVGQIFEEYGLINAKKLVQLSILNRRSSVAIKLSCNLIYSNLKLPLILDQRLKIHLRMFHFKEAASSDIILSSFDKENRGNKNPILACRELAVIFINSCDVSMTTSIVPGPGVSLYLLHENIGHP